MDNNQYKITPQKSKIGLLAQEVLVRKEKGLSAAEIALRLGVTENYVNSVIDKEMEEKLGLGGLSKLISNANALLNDTSISTYGANISKAAFWVTSGARLAFFNAISSAQRVLDNPETTEDQRISAEATLAAAMRTFSSARQPGMQEG